MLHEGLSEICFYQHEFICRGFVFIQQGSNPIAATLLSLPNEAPVFSQAQQHWIQQMIAAQTARRDEVSDAAASSFTTLTTLALTMSPPAVSTVKNVDEQRWS